MLVLSRQIGPHKRGGIAGLSPAPCRQGTKSLHLLQFEITFCFGYVCAVLVTHEEEVLSCAHFTGRVDFS